jgi:hypothetical protein
MIYPSQAIADLQAQWHILKDLDRAEAISTIHQSGVSFRRLAKALNCSATLLRHLFHALEASPADLALARQGHITTWELVRRTAATRAGAASKHKEVSEIEISNTAIEVSVAIRHWLTDHSLDNPYGIQVVGEARQLLANAKKAGKLPPEKAPDGLTVDGIIRKFQPFEPEPENAAAVSWYARWLAIWTSYAIPDAHARERALDLVIRGEL